MSSGSAAKILERLLVLGLLGVVPLAFACMFLITLGNDEAWFLLDIRRMVEERTYGGDPQGGGWTTGGIYTIGVGILYALGAGEVWVIRLFSVFSFVALLLLVFWWGRRLFEDRISGLLMAACVVALPGTLTFASTAYGGVAATALVVLAAALWSHLPTGSWARRVFVGALLGLTAATRWSCIFAIPAAIPAALLSARPRREETKDAFLATAAAAVVFGLSLALLIGDAEIASGWLSGKGQGVGKTELFPDAVKLVNKWVLGGAFLPLPFLVLGTGLWLRRRRAFAARVEGVDLLLSFSWLLWLAWIYKAPLPHLRYLWPGLFGFALALGIALAAAHARAKEEGDTPVRILTLATALACLVLAYGSTARAMAFGEGDLLSFEWAGRSPLQHFTKFEHLRNQRGMATYLEENVAPEEDVLVMGSTKAQEYLSRRKLHRADWWIEREQWHPDFLPRRVLVTPMIGRFMHLDQSSRDWIRSSCELEVQFGDYVLYRVTGDYPADPAFLGSSRWPLPPPLTEE